MGSLLARVRVGSVSCGSDSGLDLFGPHGLAVTTALPRVGKLDGQIAGAKHNSQDGTTPIAHSQTSPSPFLAVREKLGLCGTHFWGPWSVPIKNMFLVARPGTDVQVSTPVQHHLQTSSTSLGLPNNHRARVTKKHGVSAIHGQPSGPHRVVVRSSCHLLARGLLACPLRSRQLQRLVHQIFLVTFLSVVPDSLSFFGLPVE